MSFIEKAKQYYEFLLPELERIKEIYFQLERNKDYTFDKSYEESNKLYIKIFKDLGIPYNPAGPDSWYIKTSQLLQEYYDKGVFILCQLTFVEDILQIQENIPEFDAEELSFITEDLNYIMYVETIELKNLLELKIHSLGIDKSISKKVFNNKPGRRNKTFIEEAKLTANEAAKLFKTLAAVNAIPNKSDSQLSLDMKAIIGFSSDNARVDMSNKTGLSIDQKNKIVTLLKAAIEKIKE